MLTTLTRARTVLAYTLRHVIMLRNAHPLFMHSHTISFITLLFVKRHDTSSIQPTVHQKQLIQSYPIQSNSSLLSAFSSFHTPLLCLPSLSFHGIESWRLVNSASVEYYMQTTSIGIRSFLPRNNNEKCNGPFCHI